VLLPVAEPVVGSGRASPSQTELVFLKRCKRRNVLGGKLVMDALGGMV
jgi:hypothetical protein